MSQRREPREFLAGILAAVVMTAGMTLLRVSTGLQSLPELLGEGIIRLLPAEVFSAILDLLLQAAKPTLLALIVLGQLAVGGVLGRLYGRAPSWGQSLKIALAVWLVFGLGILPLLGLGLFAGVVGAGPLAVAASLGAAFLLYAGALVGFHRTLLRPETEGRTPGQTERRRSALAKVGLGLAALAVGGYGWRALVSLTSAEPTMARRGRTTVASVGPESTTSSVSFSPPPGAPAPAPFNVKGLSAEVTPTGDFYTVSKNFFDPSVDVDGWALSVEGLVERPYQLDYQAIRQLPAVSDFYTLQCISNPVGGNLWGNAHWKGVRLVDLFQRAGLKPGIRKVVFHAADDYTDSITLERALNPGTVVAYEMNGQPLDKSHGAPARVLVPGIYGMKNVKWVTRIELVDYDFKGYWMQRGWSDAAPYKTTSRLDVPLDRASIKAGVAEVGGVAFAGDRGIQAVEYSVDDGHTWQRAQLKPALAPNTWQLWVARPRLDPRRYTIRVRAIDGEGGVQSARATDPLPNGAGGQHTVVIGAS